MSKTIDIAIVNGARTPMGRHCGSFATSPARNLAPSLPSSQKRSGVERRAKSTTRRLRQRPDFRHAIYGARHVVLSRRESSYRNPGPRYRQNRLCGIGHAVGGHRRAGAIQLGEATARLGGMESMSQAPHVIRAVLGRRPGEGKLESTRSWCGAARQGCNLYMANTAELRRAAGHHARDGRMNSRYAHRSALTTPTKRDACRKSSRRWRCAIAAANPPARCSPRTIIAVRRPRWRA